MRVWTICRVFSDPVTYRGLPVLGPQGGRPKKVAEKAEDLKMASDLGSQTCHGEKGHLESEMMMVESQYTWETKADECRVILITPEIEYLMQQRMFQLFQVHLQDG